jgi:hypothetical protein
MIIGCVSWVIRGADRLDTGVNKVLAAFMAKKETETLSTPFSKSASMILYVASSVI